MLYLAMLSQKKTIEVAKYWLKSSREKRKTMKSLYAARRYADCLFFGHLILEKVLKALVVLETHENAPFTHNLSQLSELAGLTVNQQVAGLLAEVNEFNIATRYPDDRLEFYRTCDKRYVDKYYKPILRFYLEVCRNIVQQ